MPQGDGALYPEEQGQPTSQNNFVPVSTNVMQGATPVDNPDVTSPDPSATVVTEPLNDEANTGDSNGVEV